MIFYIDINVNIYSNRIPEGFLFDYVTCANYTFEIFGWLFFGVATQCLAVFLFILAGGLQMAQWADAKHRKLKKVSILNHYCI